jgi:ankyrin repeat protein
LLLSNRRVNPKGSNSDFALKYACDAGLVDEVKRILGASWSFNGGAGALFAQGVNQLRSVVYGRANPSADENYALWIACLRGHLEMVKLLLSDPRVDPTDRKNDIIRIACANGHCKVVNCLLDDKRANPAAREYACLRDAGMCDVR